MVKVVQGTFFEGEVDRNHMQICTAIASGAASPVTLVKGFHRFIFAVNQS